MDHPDDEYTPEELHMAQRLLDEKLRLASREIYRHMVETHDPALYRGPVTVPRDVVMQLREEVAEEVRARRYPAAAESPARRWPWQRR